MTLYRVSAGVHNMLVLRARMKVAAVHLELVLANLREHKLFAKPSKCRFAQPIVTCLGHIVGFRMGGRAPRFCARAVTVAWHVRRCQQGCAEQKATDPMHACLHRHWVVQPSMEWSVWAIQRVCEPVIQQARARVLVQLPGSAACLGDQCDPLCSRQPLQHECIAPQVESHVPWCACRCELSPTGAEFGDLFYCSPQTVQLILTNCSAVTANFEFIALPGELLGDYTDKQF